MKDCSNTVTLRAAAAASFGLARSLVGGVSKGDWLRSSKQFVSPLESPSAMRKESPFETPPTNALIIAEAYIAAALRVTVFR